MQEQPGFRRAVFIVSAGLLVLWVVKLTGMAFDLPFHQLGVYPRELAGLRGVLFAPLVHGTWTHLISNSLALLVLGIVLVYGYPRSALYALGLIYLGSGLCVWLFARSSYHFGASGLTHGMMFFIFVSGVLRGDRLSIVLSMIVFFLYGGMIWTIFPGEPGISYESHFFGAMFGIACAFVFRNRDPLPLEKHYEWEGKEEEAEDPLPGGRLEEGRRDDEHYN